ncbi:M48 family metallopeptidase [Roseibacillus persicicus]|uniref:Peptidase M48 n=1 Tax=Roseibacillus persicicus TaxID=454148 RepID=A0A918TRV2_9BACT|nr:M48 family metallopeptidase [Roseibacillus persicicus]MDQ8191905.1 M48 family metallopeptidase [Roseibacillus persicicus]GHC58227.1 peptidase M48 [Roseibacillus persicicus]
MIFRRYLPLALPLAILSCAAPSALGPNGSVAIRPSSPTLVTQGAQAFKQMKASKRLSTNATYRSQVNRVASRLTQVINLPNAQWEFVVFEDSTPNAFALPGGKVGVNSGLFQITQNDAGLATVLAHEIAHVTSNHADARIKNQTGIGLGAAVLGSIIGGESAESATQLLGSAGNIAFGLTFSRSQELEADRIGTLFMARAGYDPNEAVAMWQRFAAYNNANGSQGAEFLRTHPLNETRIAALREFLPVAQKEYRN